MRPDTHDSKQVHKVSRAVVRISFTAIDVQTLSHSSMYEGRTLTIHSETAASSRAESMSTYRQAGFAARGALGYQSTVRTVPSAGFHLPSQMLTREHPNRIAHRPPGRLDSAPRANPDTTPTRLGLIGQATACKY